MMKVMTASWKTELRLSMFRSYKAVIMNICIVITLLIVIMAVIDAAIAAILVMFALIVVGLINC